MLRFSLASGKARRLSCAAPPPLSAKTFPRHLVRRGAATAFPQMVRPAPL